MCSVPLRKHISVPCLSVKYNAQNPIYKSLVSRAGIISLEIMYIQRNTEYQIMKNQPPPPRERLSKNYEFKEKYFFLMHQTIIKTQFVKFYLFLNTLLNNNDLPCLTLELFGTKPQNVRNCPNHSRNINQSNKQFQSRGNQTFCLCTLEF